MVMTGNGHLVLILLVKSIYTNLSSHNGTIIIVGKFIIIAVLPLYLLVLSHLQ